MASFLLGGSNLDTAVQDDMETVFEQRTGTRPIVYEDSDIFLLSSRQHIDQGPVKVAFNGYLLDTDRDREPEAVIAAMQQEHGADCVKHLNGAFRFILYDQERSRFFAAGDKAGRKVLYYKTGDDDFLCSSHLTPLLRHPGIEPSLNLRGVSDFLQGWSASFGGGERLIEQVRRLYPSHRLTYANGEQQETMFWDVPRSKQQVSDDFAVKTLDRLLQDGAEKMVAQLDGPVNVLLSGGLDSTFLVALLQEVTNQPIHTYTWGWTDDHLEAGRAMADRYGTRHTDILNDYVFPTDEEVWFYEEPQNAFVRYPFKELYTDHGVRSYWTGLNSQATFPVCLKNIRRLDRLQFIAPLLKRLPTQTMKQAIGNQNYKASKAIDVLESTQNSTAAVIDWSIRQDEAAHLLGDPVKQEKRSLATYLDETWGITSSSYQENYNYLQLRARDTARYAYYAQDFEHFDVYSYIPLIEFSYSLPMAQKKNRRLLQRIARGRVPDHIITKGASGWDFVSNRFRETIQANESDYRETIRDLIERGVVDRNGAQRILLPNHISGHGTGKVNQMVAAYLLERWLKLFVDRDEPWRPL